MDIYTAVYTVSRWNKFQIRLIGKVFGFLIISQFGSCLQLVSRPTTADLWGAFDVH